MHKCDLLIDDKLIDNISAVIWNKLDDGKPENEIVLFVTSSLLEVGVNKNYILFETVELLDFDITKIEIIDRDIDLDEPD